MKPSHVFRFWVVIFSMVTLSLGSLAKASPDVFSSESCQGTKMSFEQARGHFIPGNSAAWVGSYSLAGRQRRCNLVTGCAEWAPLERVPASGSAVWLAVRDCNIVFGVDEAPGRGRACYSVGTEIQHCYLRL